MSVGAALRQLVCRRAGDRCEYCHVRQDADAFFTFHVEHIVPLQHGGATADANLALACHHCNLHKGPNLTGIDPDTGVIVPLFNPRTQAWAEHFALDHHAVLGRTGVGRATVQLLKMNTLPRMRLRDRA